MTREPVKRATRLITDDYGNETMWRRCPRCQTWKQQNTAHYAPNKRDKTTRRVLGWDTYCRPCRNIKQREYTAALDPEQKRQRSRRDWDRIRSDPQRMAEKRAYDAEMSRRRRARDPERAREAVRRCRERRLKDPQRKAREIEAQRMYRRLRAERLTGVLPTRVSALVVMPHDRVGGFLPVEPLLSRIRAYIGDADVPEHRLCDLGLDPRRWYAWENESSQARFDLLDGVLTGLNLHPWDVWDGPDLERALRMWGHEPIEVAA